MPNWCENDLFVYGPNRDKVADFVASDEQSFDFNKVIPMPLSVRCTESSSEVAIGMMILGSRPDPARLIGGVPGHDPDRLEEFLRADWAKAEGIKTRSELKAYLLKHHPKAPDKARAALAAYRETGFYDWYEWSIHNWDTKWNASEPRRDVQDRRIKYTFSTAWGPPIKVVRALALRFPQNVFSLRYYECGAAFKGRLKLRGERVLYEERSTYRGRRGG